MVEYAVSFNERVFGDGGWSHFRHSLRCANARLGNRIKELERRIAEPMPGRTEAERELNKRFLRIEVTEAVEQDEAMRKIIARANQRAAVLGLPPV